MEELRVVREDEPPKPSTKLSAAETLPTLSANRSVEPKRLTQMLRSELDWIVLKALEKNRARRYETANGFAADVQRYLSGEAVLAHPPSAGYRLRKILHKHRGPALAACIVAGVLVCGIIGTTLGLLEARRQQGKAEQAHLAESEERKRADKQRQAAEEATAAEHAARQLSDRRLKQVEKANDILGSIFQDLDPNVVASQQRPLQAILVERLDRAVEQIEGESIGDPKVVATMQRRFGRSLIGLGEPRKAIVLLKKALATDEALAGPDDPATLDDMNNLALAHEEDGHAELAVPLLEEAMKRWKSRGGPANEATIGSIGNLAQIYLTVGKREQGLPLLEEALKLSTETLGPEHIGTLTTKSNLAMAYQRGNDAKRAVPLFEQVAEVVKGKFGPLHPRTLVCMENLAGAYLAVKKTDLAIAIYEEAFKREKATLGLDHLDTLSSMNNLAIAYREAGKLDEALPLNEEALLLITKKPVLLPRYPKIVPHAYFAGSVIEALYLARSAFHFLISLGLCVAS